MQLTNRKLRISRTKEHVVDYSAHPSHTVLLAALKIFVSSCEEREHDDVMNLTDESDCGDVSVQSDPV